MPSERDAGNQWQIDLLVKAEFLYFWFIKGTQGNIAESCEVRKCIIQLVTAVF